MTNTKDASGTDIQDVSIEDGCRGEIKVPLGGAILPRCMICSEAGTLRCTGCREAVYCSRQHQKQHWTRHKGSCSPYQVVQDPQRGRCLVATRTLQAGKLLMREQPLVIGPKLFCDAVCLGCCRQLCNNSSTVDSVESVYVCLCGYPMCSVECSKSDVHREECCLICNSNKTDSEGSNRAHKIDLNVSPNPAYLAITPLRCLLHLFRERRHLGKISETDEKDSNKATHVKYLYQLQSHDDLRSCLEHVQQTEQQVLVELRRLGLRSTTPEEVHRVCGLLDVNGFNTNKPGAIAVVAGASMLEHDCSPNTQRTFDNTGSLMVWTARKVTKGEHLSTSYADPLWGTGNRRYFLRQSKHFDCTCRRCADPSEMGSELSTLRCTSCNALTSRSFQDEKDISLTMETEATETSQKYNSTSDESATKQEEAADSVKSGVDLEKRSDAKEVRWTTGYGWMRAKRPLDPDSDFACDRCTAVLTSGQVNDLIEKIGKELVHLERCDVLAAERFIEQNQRWLADTHFYMCDVKTALAMMIGKSEAAEGREMNLQQCKRKRQLTHQLLSTLQKVNPGRVRLRGILLYELQTAVMRQCQLQWITASVTRTQWIEHAQKCVQYLEESYDLLKHEPQSSSEHHVALRAFAEKEALTGVLTQLEAEHTPGLC